MNKDIIITILLGVLKTGLISLKAVMLKKYERENYQFIIQN